MAKKLNLDKKLALVVAGALAALGANAGSNVNEDQTVDGKLETLAPSNKVLKPQLTLRVSNDSESGFESYMHNSHSSHSSHRSHSSHSSHYSGF